MIRKQKKYKKPMKSFEAARIKEENVLKAKYGLKNKRDLWKTQAKVDYFRGRAKALARAPQEEQDVFFKKLKAIGIKAETIADVLDLKVEGLLKRRLSSVMVDKKLATTTKQARQMIVHKKVVINGRVMDAPSYLVPVADESKIAVRKKVRKPKIEAQETQGEETAESQTEATQ